MYWPDTSEDPVPYDPDATDQKPVSCPRRDDGYRQLPYRDFTEQYVAEFGRKWSMRRSEIRQWLASKLAG